MRWMKFCSLSFYQASCTLLSTMLPRENDKPNAEEYPSLPFVNVMSNMAALHAPMVNNVTKDANQCRRSHKGSRCGLEQSQVTAQGGQGFKCQFAAR